MADNVKVSVEGIPELKNGSASLFRKIGVEAPPEFRKVAEDVASHVGAQVPRRTGALAGSVTASQTKASAVVRYGKGIPYARFVEYGGRGHPAGRPGNYLVPEALGAEPEVLTAADRVAKEAIREQRWPST